LPAEPTRTVAQALAHDRSRSAADKGADGPCECADSSGPHGSGRRNVGQKRIDLHGHPFQRRHRGAALALFGRFLRLSSSRLSAFLFFGFYLVFYSAVYSALDPVFFVSLFAIF
jgi:hypothetical protein